MQPKHSSDVLIIGAGMSALVAAHYLHGADNNLAIHLVDKGRGVGGRMANRRTLDTAFDTGAQLIRARSEHFREFLAPHVASGVLTHWFTDDEGNPVFRGTDKMTQLPKALAGAASLAGAGSAVGLSLSLGQRISHLASRAEGYDAITETGEIYRAKRVVLTAPVVQVMALLDASDMALSESEHAALSRVQYRKTLVLLARVSGNDPRLHEAYIKQTDIHPHLDVIVNNQCKGIASSPMSMTFHFNAAFSDAHYALDNAGIEARMREALADIDMQIQQCEVKKWGFSEPIVSFGELCFASSSLPGLYVAGDGFGGGSVEGAWRSGRAVAEALFTG